MLYDPKWKQKTRAEPSLAGFIAWLEQQDPGATYAWMDARNCAIGQYCQSIGISSASGLTFEQYDTLEAVEGKHYVAFSSPHTFGAALERARSALASTESESD